MKEGQQHLRGKKTGAKAFLRSDGRSGGGGVYTKHSEKSGKHLHITSAATLQ